jgi:hypothetical protein
LGKKFLLAKSAEYIYPPLVVIDLKTGNVVFDSLPNWVMSPPFLSFDERDSTFWLYSEVKNQFHTGAVARVDKISPRGDTLFTFVMPDTFCVNKFYTNTIRPVIVAQPDGYSVRVYDVLSGKCSKTFKLSSYEAWDKVSNFNISPDLSRILVDYTYYDAMYDLISGDSLYSGISIYKFSSDGKYYFYVHWDTILDARTMEIRNTSDGSLYYKWVNAGLTNNFELMADPAKIYMKSTVFNYLDTLTKPVFGEDNQYHLCMIDDKNYILISWDGVKIAGIDDSNEIEVLRLTIPEYFR